MGRPRVSRSLKNDLWELQELLLDPQQASLNCCSTVRSRSYATKTQSGLSQPSFSFPLRPVERSTTLIRLRQQSHYGYVA